jgi:hypothetical protein
MINFKTFIDKDDDEPGPPGPAPRRALRKGSKGILFDFKQEFKNLKKNLKKKFENELEKKLESWKKKFKNWFLKVFF